MTTTTAAINLLVNKYSIDTSTAKGKDDYRAICETAKALGYKLMRVYGTDYNFIDKLPVEPLALEPAFIFSNQYNAGKFRVMDWYESIVPNAELRIGYYLTGDIDALNEMKAAHYVCGYCGHRHQGHDAPITCPKCLGSEYLKPENLPLLTMQPLTGPRRDVATVGEDEYNAAQTARKDAYNAAQGDRLRRKADKVLADARAKCAEEMYRAESEAAILRQGIDTDNLIYYSHTKKWVFGWRSPMTQAESEAIRANGVEIPFDYTIKMDDGTTR